MTTKFLPLALSALLLSSASILAIAADQPKPTADQNTTMEQPDKAQNAAGTLGLGRM